MRPSSVPQFSGLYPLSIVPQPCNSLPAPAYPVLTPAFESAETPTARSSGKKPRKTANKTYQCDKCERKYLSYPALYTHKKLKHQQVTNPSLAQANEGERIEEVDELFKEKDKCGGPTEVTAGFETAYSVVYVENNKYGAFSKHPLFEGLANKAGPLEAAEPSSPESTFKFKGDTNCDAVFADYLRFVAQRVCQAYYTKVLIFVLLYRECANANQDKLPPISPSVPSKEYTATQNADYLPDLSNEFVTSFLPSQKVFKEGTLTREAATELTLNFCHWLFVGCYTCSLASLRRAAGTQLK